MRRDARIFVAGHLGLIGSALVGRLKREGYSHVITLPRSQLDLQRETCVESFFEETRPEKIPVQRDCWVYNHGGSAQLGATYLAKLPAGGGPHQ